MSNPTFTGRDIILAGIDWGVRLNCVPETENGLMGMAINIG